MIYINHKIRLSEKISYGLSDGADNLVFQVMTTYLLYFYTDIYGLNAGVVAILFFIARIADVFESPLVGLMIDHTHSKFGKSRPFFLWYALPYAVFAVLTFITPDFGMVGKIIWAYITYLGLGFLYTTVNLPITSVLPTMSKDKKEVTSLGVIRQFFGSSVQIIVATFTLPLVSLFGKGDQKQGFLLTIGLFAIISLTLILNTFFQIKERFTVAKLSHRPLKKVLKLAFHNKPWMILSTIIFIYWLITSIKNQTTVYFFKYVFNAENLIPVTNSFMVFSLVGVLLILKLTDRIGNKNAMATGISIGLVGQLLIAFGAYLKVLPILFFGIVVNSIGQGIIVGLFSIMLADTIDYGIALGAQAEGFLASSSDFGVNLGLGIGGLLTAGLFSLSGYVPNQAQNASTISMINLNYIWLPILFYLVLIFLIKIYPEKMMYQVTK